MLLLSSSAPSSYYMQAGASSSVSHERVLHLCRGRLDIQPMTYYNKSNIKHWAEFHHSKCLF